ELEYLKEDRYIISGNVFKKKKIKIEQKKKKLLTISDEDEFLKEFANLQLEEDTLFDIALDHFFVKLNRSGKEEAIKRIEELTQIEKYTSKDYIESSVNDILKLNKHEKPIDSEMP
ncbi:MAG: hypothetical protein K2M60_00435, partial [Lachnospiraceae bacterium]|nr:hypothetical protein [Lachnospiraceae bacterium]